MSDESLDPYLSTDGTVLAQQRTALAAQRTIIAADRTLMAWIRTALSMISFGFSIYKFFQYLREAQNIHTPPRGARNLGIALIVLGTGGLIAAMFEHRAFLNRMNIEYGTTRWSISLTVATCIALMGVAAFVGIALRVGPF